MLDGKRVVVTGAANGIGRACAVLAARRGALVAAIDRDWADSDDRFTEAGPAADRIVRFDADCALPDDVGRVFAEISGQMGDVDVLIANAGGSERGAVGNTETSAPESWQRMIDQNFMTAMLCCREVIPAMRRRGEGRIVHITTQCAIHGWHANTPYVAAKGAQGMLALSMAKELAGDRITVNVVAPGAVDTRALRQLPESYVQAAKDSCPMRRVASTEEIAEIVLFIAGPHAGFMTGQQLVVDGGVVIG